MGMIDCNDAVVIAINIAIITIYIYYTYIYIIAPIAEQPTDPYVFVFSFTVKATQRYSI